MIPVWKSLLGKKYQLNVTFKWAKICELAKVYIDKKNLSISIAMRHLDCGSCGGCEAELAAAFDPPYLADRFGLYIVASPKEADILGVTGAYSNHMALAAERTYELMPEGKHSSRQIALIGDCALGDGPFKNAPECDKEKFDRIWDKVEPIPIKGCPPSPAEIITKIIKGLKKTEQVNYGKR